MLAKRSATTALNHYFMQDTTLVCRVRGPFAAISERHDGGSAVFLGMDGTGRDVTGHSRLHSNFWRGTLVDEMLERMTDNSVAVIPVMERGTDRFLGSVTSQDVMDLVVLMHQIDDEVQRRAEDAASESPVH